jgi:hypothetical protein
VGSTPARVAGGCIGIRYLSRLTEERELWAIFADRNRHSPHVVTECVRADDADLPEAASLPGLEID